MPIFGRYDLRDPAKEKYGKPAISYPDNSILHPTLTESLNKRKDSTTGAWPYLTLSDRPGAGGCYLTKQASSKGDDDGARINMIFDRLPGVVKTTYPIDDTYGIVTKVQTQVVIARENPPWAGERFSGEFALTAVPSANETVTVGSVTYKFVGALTSPAGVANEVLIAGTVAECLFNLASAINLDWGIGVNFGAGTTANSKAVAWFSLNTLMVADIQSPSAPLATTTTCAAGAWGGSTTTTYIFIEHKEIDANRIYRIASRVLTVPPDISYWMGKDIALPDTLQSVTMAWDESKSSGGATQARTTNGGAKAEASASHYVDGGAAVQISNGFRGEAKALFTRSFSLTPPAESDIPSPTIITPSLGTVLVRTKGESQQVSSGDYGGSFASSSKVSVRTQQIGPVLTNGVGFPASAYGIASIVVTNGGSGYTSAPSVSIGGSGGATATANVSGGSVVSVDVTNPGAGYTSTPAVTFSGGSGSGAAAVAVNNSRNFTPANVTAHADSPTGDEIYPAADASAKAEGHAILAVPPSSPTAFNSGDMILESVTVQQWRLRLFIIETISIKVP